MNSQERQGVLVKRVALGVLVAVVLVALAFLLIRYANERERQRNVTEQQVAAQARFKADSKLPGISAYDLFDAYEKDQAAAIKKYSGHRYRLFGTAFYAHTADVEIVGQIGMVNFTAGLGDASDLGHRYVLLLSAPGWVEALSELDAGSRDAAACEIDSLNKGIQSDASGNKYLVAHDCSSVFADLNRKPESPFSGG